MNDTETIADRAMTASERFHARAEQQYREEVERGEHDSECEYIRRPYLCHCSKRRREAAGHIDPPDDLIFQAPTCPRCYEDVYHDGDSFTCPRCCAYWSTDGTDAQFYDDYGDLDAESKPLEMSAPKPPADVTA